MATGNITDRHAGLHRLGNHGHFKSGEKRRRRATPVITSTFENVSDIGLCLGLTPGPPAIAGVRSQRGAVQRRCGVSSAEGMIAIWTIFLRRQRRMSASFSTAGCRIATWWALIGRPIC